MKLALLGVGNAGVRLVDTLHGAEGADDIVSDGNVLAVNTTPSTFAETDHIDADRQVLIGDTHPDVYHPDESDAGAEIDADTAAAENAAATADSAGRTPTADRREGVGGDPELGVEVAREDLPEIRRALDSVDDTEVDAAFVVAGLGGGTGCGVGSVLLEELLSIFEVPIYVLGVLPSNDESDRRAWTAARAVRTFVPMADAVLPVDNETWHDSDDKTYAEVNEAVASRLLSLFGAGEREGRPLSEIQMDPNDIGRTLGVGGLSTIGYVQMDLETESEGWTDRLRRLLGFDVDEPDAQTDAMTIKKLVERALGSKLTLPCDISTADRVLLILSGPPKELSRKGFETGRSLIEDKTGTVDVLAGDEPDPDATSVTATVLLSNVTGVPRIESLQQRAVAFETERAEADRTATESADQPAAEESTHSTDKATVDAQSSQKPDAQSSQKPDAQSSQKPDAQSSQKPDAQSSTESDTKSGEQKTDGGNTQPAAAVDTHGFQFQDSESVDTEALITEAEPDVDDTDAKANDEPVDAGADDGSVDAGVDDESVDAEADDESVDAKAETEDEPARW